MTREHYEIKKDSTIKETIKSTLICRLNEIINAANEDVQVDIKPLRAQKTPKQLRGIHRLIQTISVQLRAWGELEYTVDVVKQVIKYKCGFTENIKGIVVVKSFKIATVQELMEVIGFTEAWGGGELGIDGCFLTSQENLNITDYFSKK